MRGDSAEVGTLNLVGSVCVEDGGGALSCLHGTRTLPLVLDE